MIIFWLFISFMTLIAFSFLAIPLLQLQQRKKAINLNYAAICVFLFMLPIAALLLYLKLGASEKFSQQLAINKKNTLIETEIKKLGSIQNIISNLKQKVLEKPDARGWALLGRLYLKNQQFKESSDAFAHANQLLPQQVDILVGYAESLYFLNQWVLTAQAKSFLEEALHLQTNQPDALNLLAMDAYEHGDRTIALQYWEKLLPQLQPGSGEEKKLLQLMEKARREIQGNTI